MKQKIIFMAIIAILVGAFTSCKKDKNENNDPILYVVNGTDYYVDVYCDNSLVVSVGAHKNSGKVKLVDTSVNLPVFVEAEFYDQKGNRVFGYDWTNYYFKWNKSYKMTLTSSSSTSMITVL